MEREREGETDGQKRGAVPPLSLSHEIKRSWPSAAAAASSFAIDIFRGFTWQREWGGGGGIGGGNGVTGTDEERNGRKREKKEEAEIYVEKGEVAAAQ
jgi:hypothetical protein